MTANKLEDALLDKKGEGVLFAGRSRSGFWKAWALFLVGTLILCVGVLPGMWLASLRNAWFSLHTLGIAAMGPGAGYFAVWQRGQSSPGEVDLAFDQFLVFFLPAFGPWILYLVLLLTTRWGHAPAWVHVIFLVLWHLLGFFCALLSGALFV